MKYYFIAICLILIAIWLSWIGQPQGLDHSIGGLRKKSSDETNGFSVFSDTQTPTKSHHSRNGGSDLERLSRARELFEGKNPREALEQLNIVIGRIQSGCQFFEPSRTISG